MKTALLSFLTLVLFIQASVAQEVNGTAMVMPQIQVVPITDSHADRQYELYIELPESYEENPDKKYPVLYYTDALWHMEILSGSSEYVFSEVILVGISWQKDIAQELIDEHGPHVSRYRDYTVTKSTNEQRQAKYQFGQAGQHLAFIQEDVISFVERNYRTDPDHRAYFGYSASALFGTYILLSEPSTFQYYLLGSPSVQGDIPVLAQLSSMLKEEIEAKVFVSYGTEEDELAGFVDQWIEVMNARNNDNMRITHVEIEGTHQSAFPATGVKSMGWLKDLVEK